MYVDFIKENLFSLNKTIINYIHNLVEKGMYNLTVTAWFIYFSGYKYVYVDHNVNGWIGTEIISTAEYWWLLLSEVWSSTTTD